MNKSIQNITQNNSLLRSFQRVFDDNKISSPDMNKTRSDNVPKRNEGRLQSVGKSSSDIRLYARSGTVSTVNPGAKGINFDINI